MSSLAAKYGHGSYKKIYDDKANDALKKNRPSPNLLAVGDVVSIPDKTQKEADAKTDANTKFVVAVPKAELHVHLRGLVGEKLAKAKYKLSVPHATQAVTKDDALDDAGFLSIPIPPDAATATIEVELPPPPAPPAAPADGLVEPVEVFTMKVEAAPATATHVTPKKIIWTIQLGTLHPIGPETDATNLKAFVTGAQRRLANLGYTVSNNGTLDDPTKKALFAFQDEHGFKEAKALSQKAADQLASSHDKGAP